jgi:hypothetical protein
MTAWSISARNEWNLLLVHATVNARLSKHPVGKLAVLYEHVQEQPLRQRLQQQAMVFEPPAAAVRVPQEGCLNPSGGSSRSTGATGTSTSTSVSTETQKQNQYSTSTSTIDNDVLLVLYYSTSTVLVL